MLKKICINQPMKSKKEEICGIAIIANKRTPSISKIIKQCIVDVIDVCMNNI